LRGICYNIARVGSPFVGNATTGHGKLAKICVLSFGTQVASVLFIDLTTKRHAAMTEQLAKRTHVPLYTVECASHCQLVEFQKQEYEKARLNAVRARMAESEMEYRTREVIDGALYLLQKPLNVMTALSNNLQRTACGPKSSETPGCLPMGGALDEALEFGHEAARTLRLSLPEDRMAAHVPININEAIRDCLIISADRIDANGIEVDWRASPELPMIYSDEITIRVMLRILLDNAINAIGENGATARSVSVISRVGADRTVEVCIQDSGPGIDRVWVWPSPGRLWLTCMAISKSARATYAGPTYASVCQPVSSPTRLRAS
jgi:signal transduction histidine kinase